MDENDLKRIRIAASVFRSAIERCDKRKLGIEFEEFPHGSCGAVAQLLGKYLEDRGLGKFRYVSGWRHRPGYDQRHSHAWLRQGEAIVDITADQFDESHGPILVTTDATWHNAFEDQKENNSWDERTDKRLASTLAMILAKIEALKQAVPDPNQSR
jgi:hypothetical protein